MKTLLRLLVPLLGLVPLGVQAEGSRQLTPNTNPAVALTDPANTRSGFLEHDANFAGANVSTASRGFLKPSGFTRNGSIYNDNQRMYVLLKAGETVYYGVHRVAHDQGGTTNQANLIITARYSADGTGVGTFGQATELLRDQTSVRQSTLLTNQAGVIVDAAQNLAGPRVNGVPANGYTPLAYTNTTTTTQYVWFEFTQPGENTFTDGQRFSVYDFWDFTVKTAAGVTKPGRLFSKQWAFSAGQTDGRFSATFNMYPLIPSPKEPNRYFVKKFELAGLAPQNFFRFVTNSTGANPAQVTPNTFANTTKSQTTQIDYPEYLNFINDPDPEIWPSAENPDLQVVSTASYCKNGGGVMVFFLRSTLGGQIVIDIDLNGTLGYQAGTRDRRITANFPVGNSQVEWDGLDGNNVVVNSGTPLTLTFKNTASPIAPVNFPLWDAEDNLDGFRIQNVRPGYQGFEVLYWDDSNLDAAKFPNTAANPRTELNGVLSSTGVHTWGTSSAAAGDLVLVNTYTYGNTEQQSRNFTFTYVCDPDGDGVNDNLDIDQDNDGITNVAESGGVNPAFITANNVPRYLDPFESNFIDVNQDGVNDVYDFDLDGRPNFLDIDSDGDGIPDTIEANGGAAPTTGYDANLGRYASTGVGLNGMPDAAETVAENGITRLPITNTDNVGQPDYLDIDSDNDGIVDNIEAQPTTGYRAPLGIDTDRDGLDNRYDLQAGGVAVPLTNTDFTTPTPNDNLPDYRDLNSENDGRTDAVEGWDTNNDGIAERVFSGVDVDGDGLDDAYDNDIASFNPTNGQTPTSFPDNNTGTTERAWREILTPQTITTLTISGRIFEDVNYGGGAGRNYADASAAAAVSGFTSAAIGRPGVTVELYNVNGGYEASTITGADGTYTFLLADKPAGSYSVRVVSSTGFTSVRLPGNTTLLPVQTFANGATNKVGGEIPMKVDAGANSDATNRLSLSTIINGATTTAQSLTTINVPAGATSTVSNIDFGFNFNVISNTNSDGQGSLAQFILNSNALPNTAATLNQTGIGRPGVETSIFMIGDGRITGTPPAGLRSGVDGGTDPDTHVATIRLTAALPVIIGANSANTNLDGSRQTVVTGNTPTTSSGTSTDPEVVIDFQSVKGLEVGSSGDGARIASIGFANARGTATTTQGAAIYVNNAFDVVITDVTATNYNTGGIRLDNADRASITNSVLIGNTSQIATADGIQILGGTINTTITGNTIADNLGNGIEFVGGMNTTNNVSGNTIRDNGAAGITITNGNNNLFSQNTIIGNKGDGIEAATATSGNRFTQNVISGNTGIGIDLLNGVGNSNGVTRNADSGTTTGANGRLNFPVFTQASISGGVLRVTGFAPAGSLMEIFLSDNDASKFGEGRTFLTSVTEGSTADGDNRVGSYSGTGAGLDQGSETVANRFFFRIALTPQQLALLQIGGAQITSTATILSTTNSVNSIAVGNTSEFSGNIALSTSPLPVELTKFEAAAQSNNASLTWATASEKNNDYFAVERSINGISFERVGTVKGNGTTSSLHQYSFVDAGAGRVGQQLYYRLRQVDTDGTEAYSPVRTVTFAPQAAQITLHPNPATTSTTLDLSTLPAGTYSVTVVDMTGRTLTTQQVTGGIQHPLLVNHLSVGTYVVRVQGKNINLTQRFVKRN